VVLSNRQPVCRTPISASSHLRKTRFLGCLCIIDFTRDCQCSPDGAVCEKGKVYSRMMRPLRTKAGYGRLFFQAGGLPTTTIPYHSRHIRPQSSPFFVYLCRRRTALGALYPMDSFPFSANHLFFLSPGSTYSLNTPESRTIIVVD